MPLDSVRLDRRGVHWVNLNNNNGVEVVTGTRKSRNLREYFLVYKRSKLGFFRALGLPANNL